MVPSTHETLVPMNAAAVQRGAVAPRPADVPAMALKVTTAELTVPGVVVTTSWVPFDG